jgi:hypothetical protein
MGKKKALWRDSFKISLYASYSAKACLNFPSSHPLISAINDLRLCMRTCEPTHVKRFFSQSGVLSTVLQHLNKYMCSVALKLDPGYLKQQKKINTYFLGLFSTSPEKLSPSVSLYLSCKLAANLPGINIGRCSDTRCLEGL